jgi:hypothetical protein
VPEFCFNLQVQFLGEEGEDGGGLSREFWALLARDIHSTLFEGMGDRCILRHDAVGLQVCVILPISESVSESLNIACYNILYIRQRNFFMLANLWP